MVMTRISASLFGTFEGMMRVINIISRLRDECRFMTIEIPNETWAAALAEKLIRLGPFTPKDFSLNRWSDELILVEQGINVREYSRE